MTLPANVAAAKAALSHLDMEEKETDGFQHIKYEKDTYSADEILSRSKDFYNWLNKRRTVRDISSESFPIEIIQNIILSAGTAPSDAHKQPWKF